MSSPPPSPPPPAPPSPTTLYLERSSPDSLAAHLVYLCTTSPSSPLEPVTVTHVDTLTSKPPELEMFPALVPAVESGAVPSPEVRGCLSVCMALLQSSGESEEASALWPQGDVMQTARICTEVERSALLSAHLRTVAFYHTIKRTVQGIDNPVFVQHYQEVLKGLEALDTLLAPPAVYLVPGTERATLADLITLCRLLPLTMLKSLSLATRFPNVVAWSSRVADEFSLYASSIATPGLSLSLLGRHFILQMPGSQHLHALHSLERRSVTDPEASAELELKFRTLSLDSYTQIAFMCQAVLRRMDARHDLEQLRETRNQPIRAFSPSEDSSSQSGYFIVAEAEIDAPVNEVRKFFEPLEAAVSWGNDDIIAAAHSLENTVNNNPNTSVVHVALNMKQRAHDRVRTAPLDFVITSHTTVLPDSSVLIAYCSSIHDDAVDAAAKTPAYIRFKMSHSGFLILPIIDDPAKSLIVKVQHVEFGDAKMPSWVLGALKRFGLRMMQNLFSYFQRSGGRFRGHNLSLKELELERDSEAA